MSHQRNLKLHCLSQWSYKLADRDYIFENFFPARCFILEVSFLLLLHYSAMITFTIVLAQIVGSIVDPCRRTFWPDSLTERCVAATSSLQTRPGALRITTLEPRQNGSPILNLYRVFRWELVLYELHVRILHTRGDTRKTPCAIYPIAIRMLKIQIHESWSLLRFFLSLLSRYITRQINGVIFFFLI